MNLVRTIGWLSLGSGVALAVAPRCMAKVYGLPDNPVLVRGMGVRDCIICAGILRTRPQAWMQRRTRADAFDVGMIGSRIVAGPDRPVFRFCAGLVLVAALEATTNALAGLESQGAEGGSR